MLNRREVLVLVGVALSGCTVQKTDDNGQTMAEPEVTDLGMVDNEVYLKRVVDEEAGIVLYVTNEESYGGVSMEGFHMEDTDL